MDLGKRIKEIRKDSELTQKEFADKISVSRPFISRIESGKEKPSETVMKLIAATFEVELDWLMYGIGSKRSQRATTNIILQNVESLPISAENKIDYAECASLLVHILSAKTKDNSEEYFKRRIFSILNIMNTLFNVHNTAEYDDEDIEVITIYIEKKIRESIQAFKDEDLNEQSER